MDARALDADQGAVVEDSPRGVGRIAIRAKPVAGHRLSPEDELRTTNGKSSKRQPLRQLSLRTCS